MFGWIIPNWEPKMLKNQERKDNCLPYRSQCTNCSEYWNHMVKIDDEIKPLCINCLEKEIIPTTKENEFKNEDLDFIEVPLKDQNVMIICHLPSNQQVQVKYNDNGQSKNKIKSNLLNVLKNMRIK